MAGTFDMHGSSILRIALQKISAHLSQAYRDHASDLGDLMIEVAWLSSPIWRISPSRRCGRKRTPQRGRGASCSRQFDDGKRLSCVVVPSQVRRALACFFLPHRKVEPEDGNGFKGVPSASYLGGFPSIFFTSSRSPREGREGKRKKNDRRWCKGDADFFSQHTDRNECLPNAHYQCPAKLCFNIAIVEVTETRFSPIDLIEPFAFH
jgi:hypothetical protein